MSCYVERMIWLALQLTRPMARLVMSLIFTSIQRDYESALYTHYSDVGYWMRTSR